MTQPEVRERVLERLPAGETERLKQVLAADGAVESPPAPLLRLPVGAPRLGLAAAALLLLLFVPLTLRHALGPGPSGLAADAELVALVPYDLGALTAGAGDDAWRDLRRRYLDVLRADPDATDEVVHAPRGRVHSASPEVRFDEADLAGVERVYVLTVSSDAADDTRTYVVRQPADERGPVAWNVPAEAPLTRGVPYALTVRLDAESHPVFAPYYLPASVEFEVASAADSVRARERLSGGADLLSRLRDAAVLNAEGFALDAWARLGTALPAGASPEERRVFHYLRGEAAARLGLVEAFDEAFGAFRGVDEVGAPAVDDETGALAPRPEHPRIGLLATSLTTVSAWTAFVVEEETPADPRSGSASKSA